MRYIKDLMFGILIVVVIGMVIITTSNIAMAKVGDKVQAVCSVCHTMHHYQDGTDQIHIAFDPNKDISIGPNNALLFGVDPNVNNSTCVACHSGSSSIDPNGNGYDAVTGAPLVDLRGENILAGGTYAGVADGRDETGHNVLGLAVDWDQTIGPNQNDVPPGGVTDDIDGAPQITCAGTTGCHGDRSEKDNLAAVSGFHHGDDSAPMGILDGSTVGKSYRFLSTDAKGDPFNNSGVKGMEHEYWESGLHVTNGTPSTISALNASEHNVYVAKDINELCKSCHGLFHGAANQGGEAPPIEPWIRHPTDITLAKAAGLDGTPQGASDEYKDYPNETDATQKYSTEAPVGYDITELGSDVVKEQGQVLCISCHRAHGSEYWDDILRWEYDTIVAGSNVNTGCNRCHTTK